MGDCADCNTNGSFLFALSTGELPRKEDVPFGREGGLVGRKS